MFANRRLPSEPCDNAAQIHSVPAVPRHDAITTMRRAPSGRILRLTTTLPMATPASTTISGSNQAQAPARSGIAATKGSAGSFEVTTGVNAETAVPPSMTNPGPSA